MPEISADRAAFFDGIKTMVEACREGETDGKMIVVADFAVFWGLEEERVVGGRRRWIVVMGMVRFWRDSNGPFFGAAAFGQVWPGGGWACGRGRDEKTREKPGHEKGRDGRNSHFGQAKQSSGQQGARDCLECP